VVEEDGPYVVEMPVESEQASSSLIRPDFDFVVVSSRHKQRLRLVEIDPTNRPIVLLESIDQGSHAIVP
jgi:hypothetical protein